MAATLNAFLKKNYFPDVIYDVKYYEKTVAFVFLVKPLLTRLACLNVMIQIIMMRVK